MYVVAIDFECEAGFGVKPEHFHVFLTREDANAFADKKNADIQVRYKPDYYWQIRVQNVTSSFEEMIEMFQRQKDRMTIHFKGDQFSEYVDSENGELFD